MRQIYEFGDFRLDPAEQLLLHNGQPVALAPKVFETLLILLNSDGRLIDKDEFINRLWPEVFVEDVALAQNISQLRKALGDGKNGSPMILTVPKRGYRFVVPVTKVAFEEERQEGKPLPKTNGAANSPSFPPATTGLIIGQEPPASVHQIHKNADWPRTRRLAIGWLVAAGIGILIAGLLFLWMTSRHDGKSHVVTYPIAEQRITSNPLEVPVRNAVVSPDGRYIAYADPTGIYLRQISTGETHPWAVPKGFVAWPESWFPDSAHLLVLHMEGPVDVSKPSLWKLSLLGGDPQKLKDDAVGAYVSPDGSRIMYLPGPAFGSELWVMDSDGANPRKLISAGGRDRPNSMGSAIHPMAWSPDGQRLAYIEKHFVPAPDPAGPTVSLETIDANGGGPTVVLDDSRIGRALWWAADGRILYSYREDPAGETSNYGVYAVRVDERTGNAIGEPQPITNAEGSIGGLSATSGGNRLVLWRNSQQTQVFITQFDAGSSHWKAPRRLTLDANANIADAWKSDSKAVLFVSNRNRTWKLFEQGIDQTTAQVLVEGRSIYLPRLSADGLQVLYLAASRPEDTTFPASLMSKPLTGGSPHLVLQENGIINFQCARAPATLCIFSKLVGRDLIFLSFDLEHGAGRELVRIPNGYTNWSLSPDGSKLAIFLDRHRVRFLTLDTGVARDVNVRDWPLSNGDWSADGKSVFMPSLTQKDEPVILEVNETGNAKVTLQGNANTGFRSIIQSPDGRYGLLVEDLPGENNAWMVDNF